MQLNATATLHHYHIAKTGGHALHEFFKSHFEAGLVNSTETYFHNVSSSHAYGVVWLREPHAWAFSAIYHDLGLERIRYNAETKTFLLSDALNQSQRMVGAPGGTPNYTGYNLSNFQTCWLAGEDAMSGSWVSAYHKATAVLDCMDVVGIAEFSKASDCLALFKFSKADNFAAECTCAANSAMPERVVNARMGDKNYHRSKGSGEFSLVAAYPDLRQLMSDVGRADELLYSYALQRFFADLRAVEAQTGVQLLCE